MAKAKAPSLLDDVLARAKNRSPGFLTWFERLQPDAQAELERVRQAFNHDVHQKRAYARAIMDAARERGWRTSGLQGVISWLEGRR